MESVKYAGLNLDVWDVGGQNHLRPYWKSNFPDTDFVIFVIDSADKGRLHIVKNEIFRLDEQTELLNVPFCFFANKQDLSNSMEEKEVRLF